MDPCFKREITGLSLAIPLALSLSNPRMEQVVHGFPALSGQSMDCPNSHSELGLHIQ